MSTVYVNDANREVEITLPVTPIAGTLEVFIYDGDELVYDVPTVTIGSGGKLSFTLPFSLSQSDKDYEANWKFNYNENSAVHEYDQWVTINVVTPILPLDEIQQILGGEATSEEIGDIERAVRYIIQAHTGQFFGKFIGKKDVTGSGDSHLRLPMRLIKLVGINGNNLLNEAIALRGGGWYLRSKVWGVPSIRADYDGWHENPYTSPAPIVGPYSRNVHNFIENIEYEIDGVWGWNSVPLAVQEAARLLINDYACGDSNYRDRFLTSMTAADWRIQFHEGAFSNTGNVRANQLLAEYVLRRGWTVI